MSEREARNPFYFALLIACLLFVITVLAVAVVPVLKANAVAAGAEVPREGFHRVIQEHGLWWLLYEVAAIIVFGLLSMALDRVRRLKKERAEVARPPVKNQSSS
ncbi:MAG TPA: hypothetical protein VKI65_02695 [Gemmataceae bacterium]|nr:hypothetical protein [Gemmataceae bacterium]